MKSDAGNAIRGKRKKVNATWTRITSARTVHRSSCGKGSDRKMEVIHTPTEVISSHVRLSKDEYYLGIAKAVAQRATCLRRIYGAVIVNNDEIVSTGYNGAPRGERNCCDTGKCYRRLHQVPHGQMVEKCVAVHAEENAIISASRREMQGATLYLWGMDVETGKELPNPEPCLQCWRRIHNAGIVRVVTMGGDAHAPQSARRD